MRALQWIRQRPALLALLAFPLLAVVMTWPVAGRLGSAIPASNGDAYAHLWTFIWVKEALLSGQSPFYTHLLFYPEGVSLLFHNFAWINIAIWLPLQALFGAEVAYSLAFMVVIVLNGFAAYLLARALTQSAAAGFIAGIIVAFFPYALSHQSHPNLIFVAWTALALLALKRFFDEPGWRPALLAALFIALIGLTRWQLLLMSAPLLGLYVGYRLATAKQARAAGTLGLLALIGLLALLIMAPLLAPVARALAAPGQLALDEPESLFVDEELAYTDLWAYFVPSELHPLWGGLGAQLNDHLGVNRFLTPFLGYTVLALAIYGAAGSWRRAWIWLLAALLYMVLALGPELRINGQTVSGLMPYDLIANSFFVRIIRHPDRLNVLLSIPVANLAAFGAATLWRRRQVLGRVLVGLAALFILAEYLLAMPTFALSVPAWYEALAAEPGEFGIAGLPLHPRQLADKAYMFFQTRHGKPIVEGHVSRPPAAAFAFIGSVPLLSGSNGDEPPAAVPDISRQWRQLAGANIRYLIVHKEYLSDQQVAAWRKWLVQEPWHEDEALIVYRTDPVLGRDFALRQELTQGEGGRPELGLVRAELSATDVLRAKVVWASGMAVERDYEACITVRADGDALVREGCQPLVAGWPTSEWQANEMAAASYVLALDDPLPPGSYAVALELREQDSGAPAGARAVLGSLAVAGPGQMSVSERLARDVDISWNEELALVGFELPWTRPGADLQPVKVQWQALRPMERSYTAFLHLLDPETGALVAQADVIPRGWTYPTDAWAAGEMVEDTIWLSLAGVAPGDYTLTVGWYDGENGQRLPAYAKEGRPYGEAVVTLATIRRE